MKKEEEKEEEKGTTEPTGKTPAAGQGRKKKKGRGRKIAIGIFAALLGVTAVADTLVFTRFSVPLDKAFPGKVNNEDEIKESQDNALAVAKSLEEEGAVLLENDGALPLQGTKINLLGYGAYTPVYGGTGSGGSSYLANRTDFVTAFRNAGFEVNDAAAAVYQTDADAQANTFTVDFSIPEVPATKELADEEGVEFKYTGDASFESMKAFSDTAVIVFSRKGGEDNDLPRDMSEYGVTDSDKSKHYLELSDEEQSLLDEATATFNKVIVLINSGNAMELGFLKNEDSNGQQIAGDPDAAGDVDAALWVGDPGDVGTVAVAEILKGEVNPSGRLTDIYPYAVETTPSYYNFGEYAYTNSAPEFSNFDNHLAYLVDYQEGIYIGYRYYETRDSFDYTSREGETFQDLSYEDVVEYPFGYGLSYTDFDWTITGLTNGGSFDKDTAFSVTVEVTNTGDVAGKEVVQLYYTAPYDAGGSGIQKAGAVLAGFAKTDLIEPGASSKVTITLDAQDMASYDDGRYYSTTGSYVLEKGNYTLSLRHNSHDVEASYDYTLDHSVVYADPEASTNVEDGAVYAGARQGDEEIAVNRFDDVAGNVEYLSRDDWNIVPGQDEEATQEQLDIFAHALDVTEDMYAIDGATEQTMGASNGVKLSDVQGLDYDDPKWDELLDELTEDDYQQMLATNGWGSAEISSIGKPQTYDMDGPSALSYVFDAFIGTTTYETISYPGEVVMAATFNPDLLTAFGDAISKEGHAWHISGWYAPGANLHRNAFAGRNFEYYSEDPYLSGTMLAATVAAATKNGMYCYMKHFVMNEMETNRHLGVCTWASEQAMRELYLVPFEKGVKEGHSAAIMSAYNNLGTTWAGEDAALLQGVLRGEWGFNGTVLTDNLEQHGFMRTERALIHGGTSTLCNGMLGQDTISDLASNPSGQIILRNAAHQYLYMLTNSSVMDFKAVPGAWRTPVIAGSIVLYAVWTLIIALLVRKGKKIQK